MFRLHHKNRHARSGDRVDFKLSRFKALQVPKGWDKLVVSIVSVSTGKPTAKSGKAVVQNGSCQWTDTLSDSIWIAQEDSSKELQDCFLKLVVSMGSARSGILGEATVNMTGYMSSTAPVPVSLPLKNCNYETIIQVKILCLTPRTKLREEESKGTSDHVEGQEANNHDLDSKSSGSGSIFAKSVESSSSKDLDSTSHPGELGSRDTSFSASDSYHSYDSREGSIRRETSYLGNNLSSDGQSLIGRQESHSSQNSVHSGSNPVHNPFISSHSSFTSMVTGSGNHSQNTSQEFASSTSKPADSYKNLNEAAEETVEELRAEAEKWERNARKLMLDLDILRKEFSDHSKKQETLIVELSAAYAERHVLKKEVEQLKFSLEKQAVQQITSNDSAFQDEGVSHIQKELKDELKFQKESNADLALQLQRSQASNLELVSVLQELEETIEKQKIEIENLSAKQSKFSDFENFIHVNVEENKDLMFQLQLLKESEKGLQEKVQLLEQALEDKNHQVGNEGSLSNQTLLEIETEYKQTIYTKEEEIISLKAKLSESLRGKDSPEMGSIREVDANMIREIEALKEKVEELETDCNELTDENLELLFKLKEVTKNSMVGGTTSDLPLHELLDKSFTSFESEVSDPRSQTHHMEDELRRKNFRETEDNEDLSIQELEALNKEMEVKVTKLGKDLPEKISEIAKLESNLQSREEEIEGLRLYCCKLEVKVCNFEKEKIQLQEQMGFMQRESDISSICLDDLRNEIMALSRSLDSHVSANKLLERKSLELEHGKCELELHISDLERENVKLSEYISGLEDQLTYLTEERDCNQLELENSKSHALSLQDEICRLRIEMDSEKVDVREELQDMKQQWSEAQEECKYLRTENAKLKGTAESLIEEYNTLQESNGELRKQKFELNEHCYLFEEKLRESERNFVDCSKRIDILEESLSSMLEEVASKEKSLGAELEKILDENRRHKEKLVVEGDLLIGMYLEKEVEVENLQQEVEHLTKLLSEEHEEKERIASDAMLEVSSLRAEKANLESALQESHSKMKWIENELNIMQRESELKLQSLMDKLAASKQNQEVLKADHDKVLKLLESYKSDEAESKKTVSGLESKLKASEYERQQLREESENLKFQLQNMTHLHDEVLAFKNELKGTKSEKEKLEASMRLISGECEDLKAEKNSLVEKISALQKAVSELEECKVTLEEKLLQMEGGLTPKEASCLQDAELKKEPGQIWKTNRQYQRKMQLLEEERDQCVTKAQALEDELKLMKEGKQNQRDSNSPKISSFSKTSPKVTPVPEDMKLSKRNEMVKNSSQNRDTKRRQALKNGKVQELLKDKQRIHSNQQQREDDGGHEIQDRSPSAAGIDSASKVQWLENELAKAMEANSLHKAQVDKLMSEGQNSHAHAARKSTAEDEIGAKGSTGRTRSSLEAELIDIRERYLQMSLKYAEVETQREQLVMQLKAAKNMKRWFS